MRSRAFSRLLTLCRMLALRVSGVMVSSPQYIGRNVRIGCGVQLADGVSLERDIVIEGAVKIGRNTRVMSNTEITGTVTIGADTVIGRGCYIGTGPQGSVEIGDDVQVNDYSILGASARLSIGSHCIFAPFLHVTDSSHGFDKVPGYIKHAPFSSEPVEIGEGAWIGVGVSVLKGARIGAHSVIGAQSLVNTTVPDWSVAFGSPASVRRHRERV